MCPLLVLRRLGECAPQLILSTLMLAGLAVACVEPQTSECAVGQVCPPGTLCGPDGTCPADPSECERFPDGTPCAAAGRSLCQGGACLLSTCGDGFVDEGNGELCDLGDELNSDAPDSECRRSCRLPVCGDGIVDSDEACDNGEANSDVITDECRTICVNSFCGDGIRDRGEEQGCFGTAATYDAGFVPEPLVVADFDGDGLDDVVTSNLASDGSDANPTNSVFLGTGDGGLMPRSMINTGKSEPGAIAVADWSGDGNLDLAIANRSDGSFSVFLGDGDGTFGPPSHYATGGSDAIAAGLLDDDSLFDLAVVGRDSGELALLLGAGDGTLLESARVSVGAGASFVVLADLDADGITDALVLNEASDSLLVLHEVANVSDPPEPLVYQVGDAPIGLVPEDVDNNGQLDVIVANEGSSDVSILRNLGGGELAPDVRVPTLSVPTGIAAGLIDDDDLVDIVLSHSADPLVSKISLSLLRGTPGGGFVDAGGTALDGAPPIADVALSDLDRDGRLDAVMTSPQRGQVVTALAGDGTLGRRMTYPIGTDALTARIGDLDRDGLAEVLVVERDVAAVQLFRGLPNTRLADPVSLLVGEDVRDILVADVNYDTHLDLVAVTSSPTEILVLFGNGTGSLEESGRYPLSLDATGAVLAIGDLDRDGVLDLVAGGASNFSVHILLGRADGSFGAERIFDDTGTKTSVLRLADMDGDDILDLVVSSSSAPGGVFRGTGDGTFQPDPMYRDGRNLGRETAVGAISGDDDRLDLVRSDPDARQLRVLENKGNGLFELSAQITVEWPLEYIEIADLNGDGRDDVVGVDTSGGHVVVLLGREKGTVATQQVFSTGEAPRSVSAGDLNGDGLPDLAVVGDELDIFVSHPSGGAP